MLVHRKKANAQNVTRLKKDDYVFSSVGNFNKFYEPIAGQISTDSAQWLGHTVSYTINDDSLNERYDYSLHKDSNTYRIITLGDSFTFGQYVNTNQNFSESLEDMLNNSTICSNKRKFEVINLGVAGYDIGYAVQRFISRGAKYYPDLVIWLINSHNLYQLRDLISVREDIIIRSISSDEATKYKSEGDYYFAVNEATREILALFSKKNILQQQSKYFDDFSLYYDGPLLLLINPNMDDSDVYDVISKFAERRNRTIVDRALPNLEDIQGVFPDTHPNVYGHSAIASHIFFNLKTIDKTICL